MYTFNLFVFGHNLQKNKELNIRMQSYDIYYKENINGKEFEIHYPYHGGKIAGDNPSVVLGHQITDDDNNPNYINEVRNAKEEDFIEDYNKFMTNFKKDLLSSVDEGDEEDYNNVIRDFLDFLNSNTPEFYHVEASS